jgi:MFS family permease
MLINIRPLFKYRDYRLLYIGQFVSYFGNMLTYVALPYQIFHLTNSSLAVGNVGLVQLFPLLITSLWGGALADKLNRKKLLLAAEFGLFVASFFLLINTLFEPKLWAIYLLAGISSALNGFHRPVMEGINQSLIEHEDMPAVSSLQSFKFAVTMIGGPTIAGLILAKYNLSILYLLDTLTYIASLAAIIAIRVPALPKLVTEPILKSILDGIKYARSRQELVGTYVVDFAAMIFGMPLALFPAIAETFHVKTAIGWLYAAPSVGMLGAAIFSGWVDKISRHGVAISISATIWGVAIVAFGVSKNLFIACFFLAIAGAADAVSGLFRSTMWNQTIPQHLRGRLSGIEMISYMSGPLLGNAEAGLVAAGFGTTVSVVSGGVMCVLSVLVLAVMLPKFWKYSAEKYFHHSVEAVP